MTHFRPFPGSTGGEAGSDQFEEEEAERMGLTVKLASRLDPDVPRVLPSDTVQEGDVGVRHGARLLELTQDGDDVAGVAEGGEGLADELRRRVFEDLSRRGRTVEHGSLERQHVDEVVAL